MQQPHEKPPGQCYTQEGILLLPPSRLPELASRTPVVQTQVRPPQVNSSPAAGELLQRGVRRALRRSSGRSELLKPCTARRCVGCRLLPSSFGFAPSLPLSAPALVKQSNVPKRESFAPLLPHAAVLPKDGQLLKHLFSLRAQATTLGRLAHPGGSTGWL